MRTAAATLIVLAFAAGSADAQGRGRRANSQGIPPGHLPPAGQCRVWYDGVPPGRQPAPTNCNQAERIASRDNNARVIYGDDRYRDNRYGNDPYYNGTGNNRQGSNGATSGVIDILRNRYPDRYPNSTVGRSGYNSAAYDNGYRDGLEKGREDAGDRDSFDPVRHSRYRSADRGYNSRYGTKEQYKLAYRDGFEAGYSQGYGRRPYR